jgi:hypothetical protein
MPEPLALELLPLPDPLDPPAVLSTLPESALSLTTVAGSKLHAAYRNKLTAPANNDAEARVKLKPIALFSLRNEMDRSCGADGLTLP